MVFYRGRRRRRQGVNQQRSGRRRSATLTVLNGEGARTTQARRDRRRRRGRTRVYRSRRHRRRRRHRFLFSLSLIPFFFFSLFLRRKRKISGLDISHRKFRNGNLFRSMAEKSLGLFFWFSLLFFFFLSFIYTVRLNVLTWTTTIKVLHYYKYMIHASGCARRGARRGFAVQQCCLSGRTSRPSYASDPASYKYL